MYLFDTDTISNVVKPRPSDVLLERIARVAPRDQYISTITVSEIVYGAMRSKNPEKHLHNLDNILLRAVQVVALDTAAAYQAGRIRAKLEKAGTPLSFTDIQIASIAITNALTLITGNLRHFERVEGLRVANWM